MAQPQKVPGWQDLLGPTLKALSALGGSGTIREISDKVASDLQLPDSIREIPHKEGSTRTIFDANASWARTYLKIAGLVENSSRGVWTINEYGRSVQSDEKVSEIVDNAHKEYLKRRSLKKAEDGSSGQVQDTPQDEWKDHLLDVLRGIPPKAFERLCQRLLREAGFTNVEVTGSPGDGGIDGIGLLRVNLISFRVLFQCKRFIGSVAAREIRDFRGAMAGRSDKGLFITTGTFTRGASEEANRTEAPTIDLIDGEELCDLLKEYDMGVKTVEGGAVDRAFFDRI